MQRICPECHGHKVLPNSYRIPGGPRIGQTCGLCHGRGVVNGKRPGRGKPSFKPKMRRKPSKDIQSRREADKAEKEARREKAKEQALTSYLNSLRHYI